MKKMLLLLLLLALFPVSASAADDLLSLGAGYTNILDSDGAYDFRMAYRWDDPLFWQVKPFAGLEASSDGALYGLGGLLLDLGVAPHWYVTPGVGAGLYSHGGGVDLGGVIELRSQIELSYEFNSGDRLAAAFSHTSNAGLNDKNPGTEALTFYYHMPIRRILGTD